MTKHVLAFAIVLSSMALAQRPTNPALMEPQKAPELDYVAVADPVPLPPGIEQEDGGKHDDRGLAQHREKKAEERPEIVAPSRRGP